MSIGRVVVQWGDQEHAFDLQKIEWVRELQTKTGFGPQRLLARLKTGDWHIDEVRHVLRIGLLGAMAKPNDSEANKIMAVQFDNRPVMESLPLAITVLAVGLYGGSEPAKKDEAKGIEAEPTSADSFPSPTSTEPAQS
jgi:hypothetical protein